MAKVSVIMSVFNNGTFLKKAIESILGQNFKNFEFIIVNDASGNESLEIIKNYAKKDKRIKIIFNKKRLGLTKSLNKAIKKSQSKYIARMDADDISLPNRLKEQINFLEIHPKIALLGSWATLIDKKNRQIKIKKTPVNWDKILNSSLKENPFIHPTLMFRKEILEEIGLYNENYIYAQDYELILRILKKHRAENIAKALLLYRVGEPESISVNKLKQQEKFALKARFAALFKFGYPATNILFLIKPLLSFLIPAKIKIFIYQKLYWNK